MRSYRFKAKYGELINDLIKDYEEETNSPYIIGPDAVCLLELLCEKMELSPGMRILDMGCGAGFTSIILAKEFGVTVFANDLWFSASDNYKRFVKAGIENQVYPMRADARALPYADGFFDAAVSIDAYHYFGTDECYFGNHYARLVKPGGQFGMVLPALTREFEHGLPDGLVPLWEPDMYAWHSADWWSRMWQKTNLVDVRCAEEISGGKALWNATADHELHEADTENYLTLMRLTAIKR
ncbi:cyclopropane-fatty-acyl-phospholipid synthase family protein [Paenibacillus sp. NFR01]|uniref:SAM-dependent methyltransferase n=1 Tax=Paenibacillus sp. NFR01 TaxID=1566279 RepID=UPI0008BACC2E|nr:methyltransferase domain-containing protein [Paenibacillus sp. NFR01]SET33753.1 Mycolic acid cyclopropane synthetase [Paenibacillus sp. NFR01]